MTSTATVTETYTRVDIAKVFESFEADICLIARTTGLWTIEYARELASDVVTHAQERHLGEVHVMLAQPQGQIVLVHEYKVATDASGWTAQRPGGNIWPTIAGGSLQILLKYSPTWHALGAQAQAEFKKRLKRSWTTSSIDTTYPGLTATDTRTYASNACGLGRTTRETK
jgi:hypothetical protein